MQNNSNSSRLWQKLRPAIAILGGLIILIWLTELADGLIFNGSLDQYGIRPRTVSGLYGILWAPFLHGGMGHVMANTMPILILGGLIILSRSIKDFLLAFVIILLVSGLGTWLIGQNGSVHIGASGLVFGFFGFLLMMAWYDRRVLNVAVAALVIFFYGSIIWGIIPRGNGISWQSHFFGLIGGCLAAYWLVHRRQPQETPKIEEDNILRITENDLW